MSFLRFSSDEVKEMARTLESGGDDLRRASKAMTRADSGRLGHDGLRSACDAFAESWDHGFGRLSKLTKGVSRFADEASEEFLELDRRLCDEVRMSHDAGEK
ncbi:hypothetical protein [Streptomyces sp. WMMC905]|uniref:hypothetical protein n=1 Tax=Streptomyces sp. WMMC905 TaxID=3404123 RepID=UPI003B926B99